MSNSVTFDGRNSIRSILVSGLGSVVLCACAHKAAPALQPKAEVPVEQAVQPPSARFSDADSMPAVRAATLEEPRAVEVPPPAVGVDENEIRGKGSIDVKIVSKTSEAAFLKIRDGNGELRAAAHITPGQPTHVMLDGGSYQMFVRTLLNGRSTNLKGPLFELPKGARGSVTLMFEVQTVGPSGTALQEISPAEFDR